MHEPGLTTARVDGLVVTRTNTLEMAVRAEMDTGSSDPVEIVARLSEKYGERWLLRQLIDVVARIVTGGGYAAATVSTARPSKPSRSPARPGLSRVQKTAGGAEDGFFSSSRWVSPEVGWKRVVDLTAVDCRLIAAQCEFLRDVAGEQRRWFDDAATAIEREGVETLGQVKTELVAPRDELPPGMSPRVQANE